MKNSRKTHFLSLLAITLLAVGGSKSFAEVQIAYPDSVNTLFTIEVPKNWKLTPTDSASKFFLVEGTKGVQMWFRAMPVDSEKELDAAVAAAKESGREWLSATHSDIVLDDGAFGERDGMNFISINGTGVASGSGTKVKFIAALATLPNGSMAQLWAIIPETAPQGERYAKKVIQSFTPR
ncbi:MAG: hypothetical protein AAGC68_16530 [Verrucomicrobiota bacterium]